MSICNSMALVLCRRSMLWCMHSRCSTSSMRMAVGSSIRTSTSGMLYAHRVAARSLDISYALPWPRSIVVGTPSVTHCCWPRDAFLQDFMQTLSKCHTHSGAVQCRGGSPCSVLARAACAMGAGQICVCHGFWNCFWLTVVIGGRYGPQRGWGSLP